MNKLRNEFTDETRSLFIFYQKCFVCNQNGWNAIHHILGRISNSPLNACLIHNFKCHIGNGKLTQFEVQKKLLKQTLDFLIKSRYKLTKQDKEFMKKYKKFYD